MAAALDYWSSTTIIPRLLTLAPILLIAYTLWLVVSRLYLSPISHIPGPKLAALTLWYEFYYDVILQGQYTWRIGELHEQYGPIIRINPYEVHINDPEYYDELYAGPTKRREKWEWSALMFGNSTSIFGTLPHDHHRLRRAPLNPYFSKRSVLKLEPMIVEMVDKLCARLQGFKQTQEPLNLRFAYSAFVFDVICQYAFADSYNCLDEPDFAPIWPTAVDSISEQSHLNKQCPWLLRAMMKIPIPIVKKLNPHIGRLIEFQIDMAKQVTRIRSGENAEDKTTAHRTIFHDLVSTPELPESEKSDRRLIDEGQTIVAAGQVTTTHYLNTAAYHILASPDILSKLKAELTEAMPDSNELSPLTKLEQLPYLTAVVKEGYRISYGVTHRLQRISPDLPLQYEDYTIPAGTPVSMTSIFMHDNPKNFPDPRVFDPDRWLQPNSSRLDKYLVNFSRGTRGCLGQNLAEAEIYIGLAAVFRRFNLELFGTTIEDIEVKYDFFNPQPRRESKGTRVVVK